ncbi:DUF998 domain-containing protein [Blautia sp. MCC283]|uniref:DUF998 domain-containing protein n=1 Tax=Blautia sp. MCC283 TaxID=2592640 RepID=UPI0020792720|nr:DUF998 domain-containing protein [Blautia sp. MCC283]
MKKKNFINYCGLLGVVAFISYTAAVVFSPLAYPGYNWMAQAVSDLSGSDAHFVNGNRCIVIYHITNLNHYFRDKKQKLLFLWGICRNSTWNDDGWCIRYEHCSERVFWNSREVQCFCSNRFSGGFGNAPL